MKTFPELKPALMGAAVGAAALAIIGFTWGGWMVASKAERLAAERAETQIVTALAPYCVTNFMSQPDAKAKLAELKATSSWNRYTFIEKGGWATMAGTQTPNTAVARECAKRLDEVT